uniref:Uncharacterized protein n=1 Tax=Rhodopseudomonas palustris (strain BisA53) TaxID=316055 RepID=Q07H67_RHOP5
MLRLVEHDPEKWIPVFGKDHAQSKSSSRMTFRRNVILLERSAYFAGIGSMVFYAGAGGRAGLLSLGIGACRLRRDFMGARYCRMSGVRTFDREPR